MLNSELLKEKIKFYLDTTLLYLDAGGLYKSANMNIKKLHNAINSYAPRVKDEDVIMLVDTSTVIGNAKKGLLFTATELYYYDPSEKLWNISYIDIDRCELFDINSYNEYFNVVTIVLKNGEEKRIEKPKLRKDKLVILINDIMQIINLYSADYDENTELDYEDILLSSNWSELIEDMVNNMGYEYKGDYRYKETAGIMAKNIVFSYVNKNEIYVSVIEYLYDEVKVNICRLLRKYIKKHLKIDKEIIFEI